ncbi:hypothetical protein Ahy_B07g086739 [Arachis hypogaea]|uniref:Zinc finger PMZ-type domain-containing protein n=1 Tax=Arachis hypogaea TaxID=3818 RepID=A0A444YAC8_ARAHY|nr:hypothetical protein Ahy_B07g086739 [Arachis hypogaea]
MHVTHCDGRASAFLVEKLEPFNGWSQGSFRIRLTADTCDCGIFQSLHFPYRHLLASCAAASMEWGPCVHSVYMQQAMFKVYEAEFSPIPNKKLWPEWYGTQVCPNPAMHKKSTDRPISTRFCNEMDESERQKKRCGLCRRIGLTQKGCPNQPTDEI